MVIGLLQIQLSHAVVHVVELVVFADFLSQVNDFFLGFLSIH